MTDLARPEPCLSEDSQCRSPIACDGWGFCRERNFAEMERRLIWDDAKYVRDMRRFADERRAKAEAKQP